MLTVLLESENQVDKEKLLAGGVCAPSFKAEKIIKDLDEIDKYSMDGLY